VNQKEFTRLLANEYNLPAALATRILETMLVTIATELKKGNLVRLRNFGTFQARKSHGKLRAKFDSSKNFFR
jgi:nucleoid DNA-binding protein